jgi:branched-subunit amino acid ABC-type transport system permease component
VLPAQPDGPTSACAGVPVSRLVTGSVTVTVQCPAAAGSLRVPVPTVTPGAGLA